MLEYERLLMLKLDDPMNDSPKTHACPMCGRCYKIRSTLNRHIRYECGMARKKLACEICGKKFSRPDNLKQHEQTHVTIYFSGEAAAAAASSDAAGSAGGAVTGDTPSKEGKNAVSAADPSDKVNAQQIYLIEEQKSSLQSLQIQGQPVKIQLQNQPVKIQPVVQKIQLPNQIKN
ncbi:hypothetical protein RUM43_014731 [Polyplax serrata]